MVLRVGLIGDTPEVFRFTEILTISIPERVAGATLVATWLPRRDMVKRYTSNFPNVKLAEGPEYLLSNADAMICLRDTRGQLFKDTVKHVSSFLQRGLPVLMDRPLAGTVKEAEEVIKKAETYKVPIIASSCLVFSLEIKNLKKKIAGLGKVKGGSAVGPGDIENFGIHVVEPLLSVMGGGVQSVCTLGGAGKDVALLQMGEKVATVQLHRDHINLFQTTAYCVDGWDEATLPIEQLTSGLDGYRLQLMSFIEAAGKKKPTIPYQNILETLKTLIAMKKSSKSKREILLKEVGATSLI